MALTVLKVKNAKPGRHVDGRGLCLVVKPSGARTWVLRMQLKGHRRDYGLGSAHDVSLTDARTAAAELRRRVRDGFDPVAERRKARKVIPTFEAATRSCHETLGDGWKDGHHSRWLSGFERRLFPRTGKKPVDPLFGLTELGMVAANTVARAIARGVHSATALPFLGALPAWGDRFG